ncbi:hypothetical protein KFL_000950140 [Klebsormidium nitens]|uniref:MYND-type domain-containing protein n=1 Tax=Klebsormidium nitens TaxID=105231 RepID=A0A1Y1I1D8_KLENI|nr:hypothetical protein KFL_000950140 [Klebsormidium nitens]|eukprot:GAQ81938.1 hypothetical protein KFL_000950140 [Klebsormidium nitens]
MQEARNRMADVGETFNFLKLPSDFQKAAWCARVDLLKEFLSNPLREEFLKQREPLLNFPVLHLVVFGAQRHVERSGPPGDYPQACQLLLEAGANVHARDCNGYTALHHATSHHAQLDLARLLLKHGADPNARNRFGNNALMEPVMLNNFEACKLLYDAGADPDLEDFDGFTPRKTGMSYPALQALFARRREGRSGGEARGDAPGTNGREGAGRKPRRPEDELGMIYCSLCERKMTPVEAKRCSGCHVRPYCSKECQRNDWKEHKLTCRKDSKPHEVVVTPVVPPGVMSSVPLSQFLEDMSRGSVAEISAKVMKADKFHTSTEETNAAYAQKGRYFVLKVQVGMNMQTLKPISSQPMMAYNNSRKFQCRIEPKDPGHKIIYDRIAADGVMGLKAYFNAYVNKQKKLVIVTSPVLPAQPW